MLIGGLTIIVLLGIVPFLCGLWFTKAKGIEQGKIATTFVAGYIIVFALFQIFYIVFLLLDINVAQSIPIIVVGFSCIAIASFVYARKLVWVMILDSLVFIRKKKSVLEVVSMVISVLILSIPIVMSFLYQYADGDDALYLATATAIAKSGTFYGILPYTGGSTLMDMRHILSGGVAFVAILSRISGVHTAIIAHLLFPPFLMLVTYTVYYGIAKVLLKDEKKYVPLFMSIIGIMYIFGNVSIYTETTFMITRTWQGKAIFSNIIVPLVVLMFLQMKQDGEKVLYWIACAFVGVASIFASTMGIFFLPVFFGAGTVVIAIANKKLRFLGYGIASMLPVGIFALIYVVI